MSQALFFPSWLTAIISLLLIGLFIMMKSASSKRKLTLWDFMTSVLQALFALGAVITGVNLIWLCVAGELPLPRALIEPVHPLLAAGFFLLTVGLWVVYENLRRFRKKR